MKKKIISYDSDVLFILSNFEKGGAQKLVLDLCLQEKLRKIKVFSLYKSSNIFTKTLHQHSIPYFYLFPLSVNRLFHIFKILLRAKLLCVSLFPCSYIFSLFWKKKIYIEHSITNKRRNFYFLKYLEFFIYNSYDCLIPVSVEAGISLTSWVSISSSKIIVINNGVPLSEFTPVMLHDKKTLTIGMVSRFVPEKDQMTLIKSLDYLDFRFRLILAGDGPLIENCKHLVHQLSLEDQVQFHGDVDNVDHFLDNCDIYVQSSIKEGFGLSLVESMAKRIPSIGTSIPAFRSILQSEALLFNVGDYIKLAQIMNKLSKDIKLRKRISVYCYNRSRDYSITLCHSKYDRVFRRFCTDS